MKKLDFRSLEIMRCCAEEKCFIGEKNTFDGIKKVIIYVVRKEQKTAG